MENKQCPSGNDFAVGLSFQSGNEDFWPISRKSSVYAEATCRSPHKQTCRLTPRLAKKTISGWKLNSFLGYHTIFLNDGCVSRPPMVRDARTRSTRDTTERKRP